MSKKTIGILVGSIREGAFTRKTAKYLSKVLSQNYNVEFVEIAQLSYYDQDLDEEGAATPKEWIAFRQQVDRLDAVLFVTPEYNRSMPGVLKNAIDIGSRNGNVWNNKPAAIVGITPGRLGAMMGVAALRVPLAFVNVRLMQQPEAYISDAFTLFDDKGELTDESTIGFLNKFADAFSHWIEG
jgi:chromate reductase